MRPPKKVDSTPPPPAKAKVILKTPADASLYVDGQPLKTNSTTPGFTTPALDHGQQYFYNVRAEVVRGGKIQSESKRVTVQAGDEVTINFPSLESSQKTTADQEIAAPVVPPRKQPDTDKLPAQAKVIVQAPPEAKVYLDNQLMKSKSAKRVFATPTLTSGEQYFYDVRMEVVRDGKIDSATQRVVVRAGDEVTVNFPASENNTAVAEIQSKPSP